jgi:hypothetical protein
MLCFSAAIRSTTFKALADLRIQHVQAAIDQYAESPLATGSIFEISRTASAERHTGLAKVDQRGTILQSGDLRLVMAFPKSSTPVN